MARPRAEIAVAIVALAIAICTGCGPSRDITPHYMSDLVPGSRGEFSPAQIAIFPPDGVPDRLPLGAIYTEGGTVQERLYARAFDMVLASSLSRALSDAGLRPVALHGSLEPGDLPPGVDFVLRSRLIDLKVNKRFGKQQTVHGQYFTMTASVRLAFMVLNRNERTLYSGIVSGSDDEPPPPVHHEEFLPLETDPQEALSVALSRAIGALLIQPGFRDALPVRFLAPPASPTPHPAPTAGVGRTIHF